MPGRGGYEGWRIGRANVRARLKAEQDAKKSAPSGIGMGDVKAAEKPKTVAKVTAAKPKPVAVPKVTKKK